MAFLGHPCTRRLVTETARHLRCHTALQVCPVRPTTLALRMLTAPKSLLTGPAAGSLWWPRPSHLAWASTKQVWNQSRCNAAGRQEHDMQCTPSKCRLQM